MFSVVVLSAFVVFVSGRPSDSIVPQNVVTVPPNCPPGQEWVNGACRDVWRYSYASVSNVITAPPNCAPGQEYVNGSCRDVWIKAQIINMLNDINDIKPSNTITVPTNCPPGQQWVNGACRDVWRSRVSSYDTSENMIEPVQVVELSDRNVISVPGQCPIGYKPDALGICREIFRK